MFPAVLFDMDGLLADTEHLHQECEDILFQYLEVDGKKINKETFGMKAEDALLYLKDRLGFEKSVEEAKSFWLDTILRLFKTGVRPMPYAAECVESMSGAGHPVALCSSSPRLLVDTALESIGLKSYFDVILSGDDVSRGKPDPEIYLLASEKLGVPPNRCVVLEDSPAGVLAALNAGMRCIAVPNKYTWKFKFPEEAIVLKDLSEVTPASILRLFSFE